MAYLLYRGSTTNSITVQLADLDATYVEDTNRQADFFYKKRSAKNYTYAGTQTIPSGISIMTSYFTFNNLTESTHYDVKVVITNIVNYGDVSVTTIKDPSTGYTIDGIWTKDPIPSIERFDCYQVKNDSETEFLCNCAIKVNNVSSLGYTKYYFYARESGTSQWYLKSGSDIVETNIKDNGYTASGYITIRLYSKEVSKNYEFMLQVVTNDETDEAYSNSILFRKNLITSMGGETELGKSAFGGYYCDIVLYFTLREPYPAYGDIRFSIYDSNNNLVTDEFYDGNSSQDIDVMLEEFYNSDLGRFEIWNRISSSDLSVYKSPLKAEIVVTIANSEGSSLDDEVARCNIDLPEITYDLTPTNLNVTRGREDFVLQWDGATDATGFNVKLTRLYDSQAYIIQSYEQYSSGVFHASIGDSNSDIWEYGVTYSLSLQAYNDSEYGNWITVSRITSLPSMLLVSEVSFLDNKVMAKYNTAYATNATQIVLNLYQGSTEDVNPMLIEEGKVNVSGAQQFSGTYEFKHECSENTTYFITTYCLLNLIEIGSIADYDGKTIIISETSYGNDFTLSLGRPENWTWATAIKPGVYTLEGKNIVAVTATEWNAFTKRINEFRDYAASRDIPISGNVEYEFTEVSPGMEFTKEIYNEAVDALNSNYNGISGYCGLINKITTGTALTPSLFTIFEDEMAKIP